MDTTIRVPLLRQFVAACDASGAEVSAFLRDGLGEIAEESAKEVRPPYARYSQKGADGVKAKVTKPGTAVVVQTLRKSSNTLRRRANFGSLIWGEAFQPAVDKVDGKVEVAVNELLRRKSTTDSGGTKNGSARRVPDRRHPSTLIRQRPRSPAELLLAHR